MSIVEETRIALLDLFPELAAADAEKRAAEAEAEAKAAEEAELTEQAEEIDDEMEAALSEMESIQLQQESDTDQTVDTDESEPVESAVGTEAEEAEEPVEEGPRQNGVMLTDHAARGTDIDVLCDPDQVVQAATIMDDAGFFLEAITGVDWIKEDKMEVIYDYNQYGLEQCRVVVRAFVSRSEPEIATVSGVMPSANWHERETHDFYGIKFAGHPDLTPLLLPEDADFHPLLKDFKP